MTGPQGDPPAVQPIGADAVDPRLREPVEIYGVGENRRLWTRVDGTELRSATLESGSEAMGIDWMTWDELREAIPPAYTELIGIQLLAHITTAYTTTATNPDPTPQNTGTPP